MSVPLKKYIDEAIVALKERTGSSKPAILKQLYAVHPELNDSQTPAQLNAKVLRILKGGVESGTCSSVYAIESFVQNPISVCLALDSST